MREKLIEDDGVRYAVARGWLVYKWAAPGRKGIHDRIHFKNGVTFSIEYKATGKKATPQQRAGAFELKLHGIPSRCCDDVTDARAFIDQMTIAVAGGSPYFLVDRLANDITSFDP